MARRIAKLDLRRIRVSQSYTVSEIARLLGRTVPTVRNWIKQGLPTLTDTSPRLICGGDLKAWLTSRAGARKQPCGNSKLFCCKCGCARRPKPATVETSAHTSKTVFISGECAQCSGHMRQLRSLSNLAEIITEMTAPAQGQLNLTGCTRLFVNSLFEPEPAEGNFHTQRLDQSNVH